MTTQTSEMPRSLWREQADRWLNAQDIPASKVYGDAPEDDRDPDPPPAAPALWPVAAGFFSGTLASSKPSQEKTMGITFMDDECVYLPARDAIKIRAVDGERVIDCTVTRSALDVIGCPDDDDGPGVIRSFQRERDTVEIAAMVKYRRALAPTMEINIEASDLACILPAAAA